MPYKNPEDKKQYYLRLKCLERRCKVCGEFFLSSIYKPKAKFCSVACRQIGNSRFSAKKRGDALRGTGNRTYIKYAGQHYHRFLMAQALGRKLRASEIVHHIDGNKFNNTLSNLQIINRAEHCRIHFTKNRKCTIPNCNRKHASKGLCRLHYDKLRRGHE